MLIEEATVLGTLFRRSGLRTRGLSGAWFGTVVEFLHAGLLCRTSQLESVISNGYFLVSVGRAVVAPLRTGIPILRRVLEICGMSPRVVHVKVMRRRPVEPYVPRKPRRKIVPKARKNVQAMPLENSQ